MRRSSFATARRRTLLLATANGRRSAKTIRALSLFAQLRGEFAFPVISRGDLLGALICGAKRDGEAYAPDESDALQALAHGVGTALDTLSSQSNGVLESTRETQALMLQELKNLPRAIENALRERSEEG